MTKLKLKICLEVQER